MKLSKFLKHYDKACSVVLLEGKRNVKPEERELLSRFGALLAEKSKHIIFRSGNADGADFLFSQGVASVDVKRLQVITPYSGHRQKKNIAYVTYSLEDVELVPESEIIRQSKTNTKIAKLIDLYISGEKNKNTIKAAYILRDTIKVLGIEQIPPASFAFFYENLENPESGGTGHTMNICRQNNVPYIDQSVWMQWL